MDPAALPGGTHEDLCDRVFQAEVVIGDDEADTGKPTLTKPAQKRRPERPVLGVADVAAQHLAIAVLADPRHDDDSSRDDAVADAGFYVGGVAEQIGEGGVVESSLPEDGHLLVELGTDPRHLGLRDPRLGTERFDQVVDFSRRDPVHVSLHHDGVKGTIDPSPALQDLGEERSRAQLRDLQGDVAGLCREQPGAMPVAPVRARS